jgi:cytochrome P450
MATTASCPALPDFNPFSPAQREDPYPAYAQARAQAPVFFSPMLDMWVVTSHKDICDIVRDPARFSSREAGGAVPTLPPEVLAALSKGLPAAQVIVNYDPPAHTRLRRLCNNAFTASRVARMEPYVRELANRLLDAVAPAGEGDLMKALASPLPAQVIGGIIGVPDADAARFVKWSEDWMALLFNSQLSLEGQVLGAESLVALQHYCVAMIEERRGGRRDDLLSDLMDARLEDGAALETAEIVGLVTALLAAGQLTSCDLIGSAIAWGLREPETWEAVRRDPGLAAALIDEVLRRDTPLSGMMRSTTEDVVVNGVAIPKDAKLFIAFAAGNHDPAVFPDPTRLDLHRDNMNKSLAFGQGAHFCIGAPLARLVGRVAIEVVSQRLANLRLQPGEAVSYAPSLVFRGPEHLRLTWDV